MRQEGSFRALTYLSLFGLAITLPLVILFGALLVQSASTNRAQLEAQVSQVLFDLVNDVDRDVDRSVMILQTLSSSQRLARADWPAFYDQAKAALQGRAYLVLIDREGRQLVNTYVPYGKQPTFTGDPESLRRILQTKAPVVSNLFQSLVVRKPVFNISIPIVQDGEARYVMSIGLPPEVMVNLLQGQNLGAEWVTSIWDANGVMLARSASSDRYVGKVVPQRLREEATPRVIRTTNLDGLDVLHATARSKTSGWGIGVNIPYSMVTRQLRRSLSVWFFAGLIAVAIALVSGAFFARQITTSLSVAASAATAFGRGEAFPLIGSRLAEANAFLSALEAARKSREELAREMKQNRDWLHTTLASIADAVIATDTEGRITFLNDVAANLTGWTQDQALHRPVDQVFVIHSEDTGQPVPSPIARALSEKKAVGLATSTDLLRKTGELIPIDDSSAPMCDEAGQIVGAVLVFRDISDRRRAEKALAASEHRSRTIIESISDGFLLLDHDWRFSVVNPAAERLLRKPASELLGRNQWEEYPATVGTIVEDQYRKAVAENIPVQFESHYKPWDCWFDVSAYPSSEGLSVYFRDITARKHAEAALQRLNEDLKQFTFAASHDLREPLRMIVVYAQLLTLRLGSHADDDSKEYLAQVVNAAKRIGSLIDGLLEFIRVGEAESKPPVPVDTQVALQEALDDLQLAIRESHAEVTSTPLPGVLADPVYVRQLFQNLIANAVKYRQPGTPPIIAVSAQREGRFCTFAVKDNGIGIEPQHFARIFIPFRRLHSSEIAGAGIGLATCKRIVDRCGGCIWVESLPGQGSTFCFSLPAADSAGVA